MTGPSPHLFWSELACNDGTAYPSEWRADRAISLAQVFEALRAACGEPLLVLSGYRSLHYNRMIGGARFSQHVQGRALDLCPTRGMLTVDELWRIARTLAGVEPRLKGLGRYRTFVHIDVRPSERLAVWIQD